LPRIPRDLCPLCQELRVPDLQRRCARCALRVAPLDACIAGTWFADASAAWIRRYKYPPRGLYAATGQDRARLRALAHETLAWRPLAVAPPACVVPVPLHPARLRRRGFNPAASLARDFARACGAPLCHALARVRDTPSQTGLGRAGRRRNVRGAFRLRRPCAASVWLVDDVVTTGATLEECARVLRDAGAARVVALCAARTRATTPPRDAAV
jgi:ComF family protein